MNRVLGTLFITAVAIALAIYSGLRSLDFIQMTLPDGQQTMGFVALLATEGGIFCWLIYFLKSADGAWQRGIALVMTIVDLLGSIALFTADTMLRSGEKGLTVAMSPEEIRGVIIGLSALIALNIAATVMVHLMAPENRKRAAEQEAFDKLQDATLKTIADEAETLAAELAPVVAADWIATTRTRYTAALGTGIVPTAHNVIDARAHDAEQKPGKADIPPHCERCGIPITKASSVDYSENNGEKLRLCKPCAHSAIESGMDEAQQTSAIDWTALAALLGSMSQAKKPDETVTYASNAASNPTLGGTENPAP
ncbi:MAG: hypothetical protein ACOYYS_19380 [Chloroflexota bacterium]